MCVRACACVCARACVSARCSPCKDHGDVLRPDDAAAAAARGHHCGARHEAAGLVFLLQQSLRVQLNGLTPAASARARALREGALERKDGAGK